MNTIDFSKTGGFPVTAETFAFMQQAYTSALPAGFGDAGNNPVIISGMLVNPAGTAVSAGWCMIAGELLYCPGGVLYDSYIHYIVPTATVGSVEFEDGNLKDTYFTRIAFVSSGTGGVPAGGVPLGNFQHWSAAMIANVRTRIKTLTVPFTTAGDTSGSYTLRKDPFTGMVNLKGTITVNNPTVIAADAPFYSLANQFPTDFQPTDLVPFAALVRYHSFTPPLGTNAKDYIRQINCTVSSNGGLGAGILYAAAAYTASFNITYPTW